jgi:hypothetical protein
VLARVMPRPDPPHAAKAKLRVSFSSYPKRPPRKPPRRKGNEPEREPVEPDKPRPLSGGAAAELEFGD